MDYVLTFFTAVLGAGVFGFIQFLIERNDGKNEKIKDIEERLDKISTQLEAQERNQCRTQMLLLISDYPNESAEIMKVAEHYFTPQDKGGLGGDWYLTNLFNRYITERKIGKPEWFNDKG